MLSILDTRVCQDLQRKLAGNPGAQPASPSSTIAATDSQLCAAGLTTESLAAAKVRPEQNPRSKGMGCRLFNCIFAHRFLQEEVKALVTDDYMIPISDDEADESLKAEASRVIACSILALCLSLPLSLFRLVWISTSELLLDVP